MGAANSRLDQLSCCLSAAALAHAAGAHGSPKYLHQSEWYGGLGVLPVGLRGSRGWPANGIPRSDYGGIREAQQPLGHRAQPHFARAEDLPGRSGERAFRAAATCKAVAALIRVGKLMET